MKKLLTTAILLLCSITYSQTEPCTIPANFKEPKGDREIRKFLEMTDATIEDMKKHVSVDLGVSQKEIVLLQVSEQKGNALYILCINGQKYKYKRVGSAFFKDSEKINN